jgi:hypothetical protein
MTLTPKQLAGRKGGLKGGLSQSAAKRAASAANGAKGGRPRKDGRPPAPAPPPELPVSGVPPLWQRLEAFLRTHGPTTLRSLRCVAVDRAERERVREVLQRRPQLFCVTPSPTFGNDVWDIRKGGDHLSFP